MALTFNFSGIKKADILPYPILDKNKYKYARNNITLASKAWSQEFEKIDAVACWTIFLTAGTWIPVHPILILKNCVMICQICHGWNVSYFSVLSFRLWVPGYLPIFFLYPEEHYLFFCDVIFPLAHHIFHMKDIYRLHQGKDFSPHYLFIQ